MSTFQKPILANFIKIAIVSCAVALLLASMSSIASINDDKDKHDGNKVKFQIKEQITADNDFVSIDFGLTVEGKTPADATNKINVKMQKAKGIFKKYANVKIKTTRLRVNPRYKKSKITHWTGTSSVKITGANNKRTLSLISKLQEHLNYQSINFFISPEMKKTITDKLLITAITRYREQAQTIATAFGSSEFEITETSINTPSINTRRYFQESAPRMMSAKMVDPVIEAGDSSVTVNISGVVLVR